MTFYRLKIWSLIFLFPLIAACGAKKVEITPGRDFIFFPSFPNTPRFQYLTTFSDSSDIEAKKAGLLKFVAGDEEKPPDAIRKAYGIDVFEGIIYVADIGGGSVVRIDLKNRAFDRLGLSGSGKLIQPANLKVDKLNRLLYVADMGRKQVVAFDLAGTPAAYYGEIGQFEPSDVDISGDRLFVCDVKGHKIHVLDRTTGETLYSIGEPGSQEGQLFHPTNIDINNNRLYVSETTNFRVQIFDLDGHFLSSLGQAGDTPGSFSRNKGIAVDREERVYVVDAAFENVQVFDKDHNLLLFMLSPGAEPQNINLPAGIAVDYDNLDYFREFLSPGFLPEYLVFVTSNFGLNKVNVYAYGLYQR